MSLEDGSETGDPRGMPAAPLNAHYGIEIQDARKLVRLVRTQVPFGTVGDMIEALAGIFEAVKDLDGAVYSLIVDNRDGPARTDPGFLDTFRSFRQRLDGRFLRVGVLLATENGVRVLDESGPSPNVRASTNEGAVTAWAEDGLEPPPMSLRPS
jgi:hypothetical protein